MKSPRLYFSVKEWVKGAMIRAGLREPDSLGFSPSALGVTREAIRLGEIAKKFVGIEYETVLIDYMEMRAAGLLVELEAGTLSRDGYVAAVKLLRDVASYPYTLISQEKDSLDQIADWREQGLAVDGPLAADADEPEG